MPEVFMGEEDIFEMQDAGLVSSGVLTGEGGINLYRGYVREGAFVKLGIKVENTGQTVITDVKINLDLPDGLMPIHPKVAYADIGVIEPKEFQSANFKTRPDGKCVDGFISGIILYRDYLSHQHSIELTPLKLVSICPMLEEERISEQNFIDLMRSGKLKCNKTFIKFKGKTKHAFDVAKSRVKSLTNIDEDFEENEDFITAYACFYGKTKYKNYKFAVEILANGSDKTGCLTIIVYSNEPAILTGFFSEVQEDIERFLKVIEESSVSSPKTCAGCGAPIELSKCDEKGYHCCDYCKTVCKLAEWNW